jgi:U3 small nucleolar RNA-associated protein 14
MKKYIDMIVIRIDEDDLIEIRSILAKCGRPDLIESLDEDYTPPKFVKREKLSETESSAEEESDYEVEIDKDGFHSLK